MACENNDRLLQGYFDGELDLVRSVEFENHLKMCPECAHELKNQQAMRRALRGADLLEKAPKSLETRIVDSLPREKRQSIVQMRSRPAIRWFAFATAIALAIFLGAAVVRNVDNDRQALATENFLAQEIVSSHIHSLQAGHLFDVESTDQHTVKPWFDGKLDFAPPVVDLADYNFRLLGGRLEYLDGRSVAALVYQRQKHLINVFIWPQGSTSPKLPGAKSIQGYNLISWKRDEMEFCAVSDLNAAELRGFVRLLDR
ncbi:MAG: anti-sigma factor family protein [Terriglobales bacterium]|jgi:anti-sigma factor RsiW